MEKNENLEECFDKENEWKWMTVLKRENVWMFWKNDDWLWKKVEECWKWWNGRMEKYECWNSNVIENEKMCVEMLKDVKSVKCKRKIM